MLGGPHTESFLTHVLLEKGTVNQKSPKVIKQWKSPRGVMLTPPRTSQLLGYHQSQGNSLRGTEGAGALLSAAAVAQQPGNSRVMLLTESQGDIFWLSLYHPPVILLFGRAVWQVVLQDGAAPLGI